MAHRAAPERLLTNRVKLLLDDQAVMRETLAANEGILAVGRLLSRHA